MDYAEPTGFSVAFFAFQAYLIYFPIKPMWRSMFASFIRTVIQPMLRVKPAFLVVFLVAVAALLAALLAQFGFGLKPCILCLYQRVPYAVLLLIAPLGLWLKKPAPLLLACAVLFLASTGLALFHTGVEQHWWVFGSGCPVESLAGKTDEQALAALLATPLAPCDKVAWRLLGVSITVWNALLSFSMAVYVSLVFWRRDHGQKS